jgi:hypothetical protein
MDKRVGPPRDKPSCGYNSGSTYDPNKDCNATPVVVHLMFDTIDDEGYYPGGFGCEKHKNSAPDDLIKLKHNINLFCTLPGSIWDFELNECIMPLEYYEEQLLGEVIEVE